MDNGECLQNVTGSEEAGQCYCKPNVHGKRCDECERKYFGLRSPPVGTCKGLHFYVYTATRF